MLLIRIAFAAQRPTLSEISFLATLSASATCLTSASPLSRPLSSEQIVARLEKFRRNEIKRMNKIVCQSEMKTYLMEQKLSLIWLSLSMLFISTITRIIFSFVFSCVQQRLERRCTVDVSNTKFSINIITPLPLCYYSHQLSLIHI